jgi:hypothetical protein
MCQFHKRRYLGYITSDKSIEISRNEYDENVGQGQRNADKAWRSKMRGDYYTYFKKPTHSKGEPK